MCVICTGRWAVECDSITCCSRVVKIPSIPGIKILRCSDASGLAKIPAIASLVSIICDRCPYITTLPDEKSCPNLVYLSCDHTQVSSIPRYPMLKKLSCNNCPILTELPLMPTLEVLDFIGTPLRILPVFPNLRKLSCGRNRVFVSDPALPYGSPYNIPVLPALVSLIIRGGAVTTLPCLPSLTDLICEWCPYLLSMMPQPRLLYFQLRYCPLLYVPQPLRELAVNRCPVSSRAYSLRSKPRAFTTGSRIRAWALRGKIRTAARAEMVRILRASPHAAFVSEIIKIIASIM